MVSLMPLSPVLILVAFCLCLWLGTHLYVRYGAPPLFESVRAGQWHYIVLGAGVVFWLDTFNTVATDQEDVLRGILGLGLVWIGFRVGLDLDIRQYSKSESVLCAVLSSVGWPPSDLLPGASLYLFPNSAPPWESKGPSVWWSC